MALASCCSGDDGTLCLACFQSVIVTVGLAELVGSLRTLNPIIESEVSTTAAIMGRVVADDIAEYLEKLKEVH